MTLNQKNWGILKRNSLTASVLGRCIMGVLYGLSIYYLDISQRYFVLYFGLDMLQYINAIPLYYVLARNIETKKIKSGRPYWINYPSYICWFGKFCVLFALLGSLF